MVSMLYHYHDFRFVVESLKIGVEKIVNRRLRLTHPSSKFNTLTFSPDSNHAFASRSVFSTILVGGARSYPKLVVAILGHYRGVQ